MPTSQNGYPVPLTLAQRAALLTTITVKGGRLVVRKGDTATIFAWLFAQLNAIEDPLWPGCWGQYARAVRGTSKPYSSNHSSGTAFDRSAPLHPRQSASRYRGWSAADVAFIHHLLAQLEGVIRWGGDYHSPGPFDPMHFEVIGSPAQIARVAAKIRAGQLGGTGAPTVTATRVSQSYVGPQVIPADAVGHLLRVLTGTPNLSVTKEARVVGLFIVYGTGKPGETVQLQGVRATLHADKSVTNSGLGWDDVTVGPDGTFERTLPISTDLGSSQFLRVMAQCRAGCTVTTVVSNFLKG